MQVFILLKCNRCKWYRKCKGTSEELKDLVEFKPCLNCHGPRKFKCPGCATIIKSMRVEQPDPPELKETPPPPAPEQPALVVTETIQPEPAPEPKVAISTSTADLAKEIGRMIAERLLASRRGEK